MPFGVVSSYKYKEDIGVYTVTKGKIWSSLLLQKVKDLGLSLLWWGFNSWPGNFSVLWKWPKKGGGRSNLQTSVVSPCSVLICDVFY